VCSTWGKKGKRLFLLNVFRNRLEYPDLKRAVVSQARLFDASTVLIEDAASGIALIQDLKNDGFYNMRAVKPKGDKTMRLQTCTGIIEAGFVLLPTQAPWVEEYLHELMMFPAARHDDQVDSTSQALAYFASENAGMEGWIEYMRQELAQSHGAAIPTIRVNHTNLGMSFQLINGRMPVREADGSFLLTEEELAPLRNLNGLIVV
jgi:predicted phage terminase large subunit-like protein